MEWSRAVEEREQGSGEGQLDAKGLQNAVEEAPLKKVFVNLWAVVEALMWLAGAGVGRSVE